MEAETYFQQTRNGDTEWLLCPGAPQGPAQFRRENVLTKGQEMCQINIYIQVGSSSCVSVYVMY